MKVSVQVTYFYATGTAPVVVDDDFSRRFVRRRIPGAILTTPTQGDWLRPFSVVARAKASIGTTTANLTLTVNAVSVRGRSIAAATVLSLELFIGRATVRARARVATSLLSFEVLSTVVTGRAAGAVGAAPILMHTSLMRVRAVGRVNEQRLADEELLDLLVLLDAA